MSAAPSAVLSRPNGSWDRPDALAEHRRLLAHRLTEIDVRSQRERDFAY
ncbi:MAG: hypothetical protein ABEJ40_02470 [Haloarculaceae archaeon]